jgi:hypothetical protein
MWNTYNILTQIYPVCVLSVVRLKLIVGNLKKYVFGVFSHCVYLISGFVKIDEMFQKLK